MSDAPASPTAPEPPSLPTHAIAEGRLLTAAAVAAWLLALVAVNVVPYVPTHDGPQHIYLGHVINHFSDPDSVYPSFFRPTQPLSAMGFSLLFCPLDDLLGWEWGFRVALSVLVSLWGWGAWALVRALAPARTPVAIVGFALAFQWAFYMGFFSWLLSMAVGFFTLSIAVRSWPWTPARRGVIAGLLFVHALMHVFPALVTALVLVTLVLARSRPRNWPKELGALAITGIPVALVAAYAAGWVGTDSVDLPTEPSHGPGPALGARLMLTFRAFAGGPLWRSAPVVIGAIAGLAFGLRGWLRGTSRSRDRAFWLAGAILLSVFLVAPLHLARWEFFSPRFLPPALVLLLVTLPIERASARLRSLVFAGALVYSVAALAWTSWFHLDMAKRTADVRAALAEPIRRTGPRLPIVLDGRAGYGDKLGDWYPYFEPMLNLGALFAITQGGVVPYTFTSVPQLHGLVLTKEGLARMPPAPHRRMFVLALRAAQQRADDADVRATLAHFAAFGAPFEDVILYAPDQGHDTFLERGYHLDAHHGHLRLMHFVGCPVRVSVDATAPLTHPLTFEYGWYPVTTSSWRVQAPAGTQPRAGQVTASLDTTPCGPVWLRVWSDENANGAWDAADRTCVGASSDARIVVALRPGIEEVRCKLGGAAAAP